MKIGELAKACGVSKDTMPHIRVVTVIVSPDLASSSCGLITSQPSLLLSSALILAIGIPFFKAVDHHPHGVADKNGFEVILLNEPV